MAAPNFDPTTLVPPQETVNGLIIPPLTGAFLGLILCGMCNPRLFDYYSHFPQDRRRNKVAVSIVGLGIIAYTVMLLIYVINIGSMRAHTIASLYTSSINTAILPLISTLIALPTHLILAERAWRLNRGNIRLGVFLGLVLVASFVGSVLSTVYNLLAQKDVLAYGSAMRIVIPALFITHLTTDLSIVIWTLLGLRGHSKTFLASQQEALVFGGANLISAAWQTSVESAVFPTCLNVVALVLHYLQPARLWFAAPSFMIPPVYCLTLLFSLERRQAHLTASHFHAHLPNISTGRERRLPNVKIASIVHYSTHTEKRSEGSVGVTLSGDGHSVGTPAPGSEVRVEGSYFNQSGPFQIRDLS